MGNHTIQIVQGTYVGSFTYASSQSHGLNLEGGYTTSCVGRVVDAPNTVLDGNSSGAVLTLADESGASQQSLRLRGSLFRMGTSPTSDAAGGLYIVGFSGVAVSDNAFFNNRGYQGGGVGIGGHTVERITLLRNDLRNNYAAYAEGGGIWVEVHGIAPVLNVVNNVISKNYTTGGHGGGAHLSSPGITNVISNTIVGNSTPIGCGGGITVYHSSAANLYNNLFWDNAADNGRDICFYDVAVPPSLYANDLDLSDGGVSMGTQHRPQSLTPAT